MRISGELTFPSRKVLDAAVATMYEAIADEDECDSIIGVADLQIVGTSIRIEHEASCPATLWEETLGFLELLGEFATEGALQCFFEGERGDSIEARAKTTKPKTTKPKTTKPKTTKPKARVKADPQKLRMAAQFGELEELAAQLAAGADPSAPDPSNHFKTTPLMMAAYHGKHAALVRLLAAGAALESQDAGGATALFYALYNKSKRGRQACIQTLFEAGASMTIRNLEGKTALESAKAIRGGGNDELTALIAGRERTYGGKKTILRSRVATASGR